jgi:hypothetical protein
MIVWEYTSNGYRRWTEVADRMLTDLWARGDSGTQIGAAMGISKNAVVGRAHRLRLPSRLSPIKAEARQYSAPRPRGALPGQRRAAAGAVIPPAPAATTSLGAIGAPRPGAAAFSAQLDVSSQSNSPGAAACLTNPQQPRVFLDRKCQFPMWGDAERATQAFCGVRVCARVDGTASPYRTAHHARCFTVTVKQAGPIRTMEHFNTKQRGMWRAGVA